ncbi:aspartate aminotransferase family protein [Bradyrhizobium arachidis]|uniref:pyridoxal phosphate-dependent decarboxylase family protein n=1 Tax=Bradyrhizobium arachidis TaxID=858423 RepID=UPI0021626268|nr:aspartate aminotransferase family protein [Bradyrhizobium arachidis]UVO35791.1 aspartate aminotransferase family protein [Bradyrhizobium arachidis]
MVSKLASSENRRFAEQGLSEADVRARLDDQRRGDMAWNNPRNLKAAYYAGDDVFRLARDTYAEYHGDNLLYGKALYPSLVQMSSDVVGMSLELLGADADACGTITSGGTESIILAVRAAKNWARAERSATSVPEILMSHTGHPAFNKAAEILGLKVVRVRSNSEFRADVEALRQHINENTIMIVGSAPTYPMGCVDPIADLAQIANDHGLWLHVDACVGGFFLPFAREFDDVPAFDFTVKGVRSISADLHKYGYTSRGASLLLLADKRLEQYQRFFFDGWPVGEFVTPTINGSRPGGAVASAWAVMNFLGRAGYRDRVKKITEARRALVSEIGLIEGLRVLGRPYAGIVGIGGADSTDMRAVGQGMIDKGWKFAPLVDPVGINILLNYTHGAIVRELADDLKQSVVSAKSGRISGTFEENTYGA